MRSPGARGAAIVLFVALAGASSASAAPAAGPAECRLGTARTDTLAGVDARGEMRLASGATAVLGSIRWPDDPAHAEAAHAWLAQWRGRSLALAARGEADRWGRLRVDARLGEEAGVDLAEGLVSAGLAFADADEGDVLCRPALAALEEAPRKAGLGVWSGPALAAADGTGLRERAGRFAVVAGRVRHVGERRTRTYLDFVRRGEDGLSVTVSKRTWRRLLDRGLTAAGLTGRTVRVRGIVEVRRGPTIDLGSAEAVEVLAESAADGAGTDGERAPRR